MTILLAVDVGASGGIAYSLGNTIVTAIPMPKTDGDTVSLLSTIVEESGGTPVRAVVEQVGGYIGEEQPGSAAFNFGFRAGIIHGALMTLGVRIELVRPQAWQKALGLGNTGRQRARPGATDEDRRKIRNINARMKTDWKNKLKQRAQELFPQLTVTLSTADALLILEYARRTQQQP